MNRTKGWLYGRAVSACLLSAAFFTCRIGVDEPVNGGKNNAPPVLRQPSDTTIAIAQTLRITLSASDPDGDALIYFMRNSPAGASLSGNIFTWTPVANQTASYLIDFVVTEQTADSLRDTSTVRITVQDTVSPVGLVAYWDFDDGTGTTLTDRSGNGNHGTINGATWVRGISGTGLNISAGSGGQVRVPYNSTMNLGSEYTVSAWTKMHSKNNYYSIITSGTASPNDWDFYVLAGSPSQITHFATWTSAGTYRLNGPGVDLETWSLITAVKTPDSSFLYTNGMRTAQMASSGSMNLNDFYLGRFVDGSGYFYDGVMDEIRIYNRALSTSEITSEWDKYKDKIPPTNGLAAYWPFSGNANDASGSGNNGTVNGATLTADRFGNTNGAYSFNGVSNYYVQVPSSAALNFPKNSQMAICAWVNVAAFPASDGASGYIVGKAFDGTVEPYFLRLNNAAGLVHLHGGSHDISDGDHTAVWSISNWSVSEWHFAALTYDGSQWSLYFDGQLKSTNITSGPESNSQLINIGKFYQSNNGAWGRYFNGSIDDIRIYNRALSATEIQVLYNEGR